MVNQKSQSSMLMDPDKIKVANDKSSENLQNMSQESEEELNRIRIKLNISYWILISLSVIMFGLGIILLLVPVFASFNNEIDKLQSIISAGFGIADITALFLYGPIEKIHKNMGDMSQIMLALNSYRTQVELRLWEMDVNNNRSSIGIAAEKIGIAAEKSIMIIQKYFEEKEEKAKD